MEANIIKQVNLSNAEAIFVQHKLFENHLNLVVLVFVG